MRVLTDTNILLRRVHRRHPQHRLTKDAITLLVSRGDELCVASQNLIEVWAVCTRPIESNGLGLLPVQASRILSRIESGVVRLNDDTDAAYSEWRRLVQLHGVSGKKAHDARLVAAMKVHGIAHVLTYNTGDFQRFDDIVALHPDQLREPA